MPLFFEKKSNFSVSSKELFLWHARPGAFERLNPPWNEVKLLKPHSGIEDGKSVSLSIPPLSIRWTLEHEQYIENEKFCDRQVKGPFSSWFHEHIFKKINDDASELHDKITFSLPFGFLSEKLFGSFIKKELTRLFNYRHEITALDLASHSETKEKLKFLITGGTGLLGSTLSAFLTTGGHKVTILNRNSSGEKNSWDGVNNCSVNFSEFDCVIHLAGSNIGEARWSKSVKKEILESRTFGTALLAKKISELKENAPYVISASAAGFYGDTSQICTEISPKGEGFLSDVVKAWEDAWIKAEQSGVKVCKLRFGVILSPKGGALKKMFLPFLLGLGGKSGDGKQLLSWVALDEVLYIINFLSQKREFGGVLNVASSEVVTNEEFSKLLAKVLKRPCIFWIPKFVLKLLFGEMAKETILSSNNISSKKLESIGYKFKFNTLESWLKLCLGR